MERKASLSLVTSLPSNISRDISATRSPQEDVDLRYQKPFYEQASLLFQPEQLAHHKPNPA